MAILKVVNIKKGKNANLHGIINYVLKPGKTTEKLCTGLFCEVPSVYETMMETKELAKKKEGRQYYHFVQSFPPAEKISAQQAHELALEFAQRYKKFFGFEMLVVTHIEREHIHSHFIVNSVNFINSKKFQMSRKDLKEMKDLQNKICIEKGFSPAPEKGIDQYGNIKRNSFVSNSMKLFQKIKRTPKDSYINNCAVALEKSIKMARTKEQFLLLMKTQGYDTEWNDRKKNITFSDISRKRTGEKKYKVRLKKLAQCFSNLTNYSSKEKLLYGITKCKQLSRANGIRNVAKPINTNPRINATNTGLIDFNTGFEQYIARSNSKHLKYPIDKVASSTRKLFGTEHDKSEFDKSGYKQRTYDRAEVSEKNSGRNTGIEEFDR